MEDYTKHLLENRLTEVQEQIKIAEKEVSYLDITKQTWEDRLSDLRVKENSLKTDLGLE
jgi:hypothetical protein